MSRETVTMELVLHYDAAGAWRVSETGDAEAAVWLPKSRVDMSAELRRDEETRMPVHEFEIPEWLAVEKGLV